MDCWRPGIRGFRPRPSLRVRWARGRPGGLTPGRIAEAIDEGEHRDPRLCPGMGIAAEDTAQPRGGSGNSDSPMIGCPASQGRRCRGSGVTMMRRSGRTHTSKALSEARASMPEQTAADTLRAKASLHAGASVRSRSADFCQVSFEPRQVPTAWKPALSLDFRVPYGNAQVRRPGANWPPESDFRPSPGPASHQVCPENSQQTRHSARCLVRRRPWL